MLIELAIAGVLLLLPLIAWKIGPLHTAVDLRDRMLLIVGWAGVGLTLWMEPGLGLLFSLAMFRWHDGSGAPGVVMFAAAALIYAGLLYGPEPTGPAALAAIVAGAMGQALWAAWDLCWRAMYRQGLGLHAAREAARASMGNRVIVAAYCAFAAPLAPVWALPVLGVGLLATNSYLGFLAAFIGLCLAHPAWTPSLLAVSLLAWPAVAYWRGNPIDSWRGRLDTWRFSLAAMWHAPWPVKLCGHGHGSFPRAALWWSARGWTRQCYRQAHNDLVQVFFECGLIGVFAVGLWLGSLSRGLELGDPLTAALASALVSATANFPFYLPQTAIPVLCVAALLARKIVS